MFKEYILLLLLGHIIGDFYTQTAQIAEKKKNSLEWVLKHGLLYFITVMVVSIPVIAADILILDVVTALLHVMIDVLKFFYLKKKKKETSLVFITDQALHLVWDNSLLGEMKGWIKEVFCKNGWKYIEERLFEEMVNRLEALYDKLPVQLIHRDVHFGNFLFDNGKFSGYIDFDLSQRNIRIFDLCYFVLGLLSEEDKLEVASEEWFSVLKDVFEGYNSKLQLSEEERMAVPYVMKSIELLFAAWFLGQNDIKCVESAMKIFGFVDESEEKIFQVI